MGKTLDGCLRAATITAHPRSRGENQLLVGQRPVLAGSSPLTRGKRKSVGSRRYQEGLIPAHAGKTATRPPPPSSPTAHPRSRGENTAILPRGTVVRGSSPLTWGKLEGLAVLGDCLGLIPAHVGKTLGGCLRAATITAHPRSRGENAPRRVSHSTHRGLIPAHTGKTKCRTPSGRPRQAHPHSRGENHSFREGNTRTQGSSPLTRGNIASNPEEGTDVDSSPPIGEN